MGTVHSRGAIVKLRLRIPTRPSDSALRQYRIHPPYHRFAFSDAVRDSMVVMESVRQALENPVFSGLPQEELAKIRAELN